MRRKEKEITDFSVIEELMHSAGICRVGMCLHNKPYVVPLNFGYHDRKLYFHSAAAGKKIEILRANPEVFVEVSADFTILPGERGCDWAAAYHSVMAEGTARFLEDPAEKKGAMDRIMLKYSGRADWEYDERVLSRTVLIEIALRNITGKQSAGESE